MSLRCRVPVGNPVRLRIRARDVALAVERPRGVSILSCLAVTVAKIGTPARPHVNVRLQAGGQSLWARIARLSARELAIAPVKSLWALIKSMVLERGL